MARHSRKRRQRSLAAFITVSFFIGVFLGTVLTSIWIQGAPTLHLSPGESYTRSITIVGIDKNTGQGRLATLTVELRTGSGRLAIAVPPYENEDTQKVALDAKSAAELMVDRDLSHVDIIISVENISPETTITGPSASATIAVLIVAAVHASENASPNMVRQDAVVSAAINSTGRLEPVGEIEEKYEAVRNAGSFTLFIVAKDQSGNLWDYPNISVEHVLNLRELAGMVLW